MDGLVEKIQNAQLLFIGGAPRSGTTLLSNLLDGHPNLIVFPLEHSVFEQYYWNQNNLDFFRKDFITNRGSGQQGILADQERLNEYRVKITKEYNKDFDILCDTNKFYEGYTQYLDKGEIRLRRIFEALAYGLVVSNEYARNKVSDLRHLVFKKPFHTMVFASDLNYLVTGSKFLQITRNPFARYASAKTRRLKLLNSKGKKLGHINRANFVLGHTEIDQTSRVMGNRNQETLGADVYKIISYEDMLADSEQTFLKLSNWLEISKIHSFSKPTRLGSPAIAGSVLTQDKGVDISAINRTNVYRHITTWNERKLHKIFLSDWPLRKLGVRSKVLVGFYLLFPFHGSSLLHYFFQIVSYPFTFLISADRLIQKVRRGKVVSSGAT